MQVSSYDRIIAFLGTVSFHARCHLTEGNECEHPIVTLWKRILAACFHRLSAGTNKIFMGVKRHWAVSASRRKVTDNVKNVGTNYSFEAFPIIPAKFFGKQGLPEKHQLRLYSDFEYGPQCLLRCLCTLELALER